MGFGFKELVIILLIVLVLFGAKRLRNIGSDLGSAIRGFRKSMHDGTEAEPGDAHESPPPKDESGHVIEGEAHHQEKNKV